MESIVSGLLSDFENGRMSRRDLVKKLTLAAVVTAAGVPTAGQAAAAPAFKALSVNHISYSVADYARIRDFYADLLGMTIGRDDGKSSCHLYFGNTVMNVRKTRQPDSKAFIDHMAYSIANWDKDKVKAELERRGLDPRPDANSYHIKDPEGFDVQIAADDAVEHR